MRQTGPIRVEVVPYNLGSRTMSVVLLLGLNAMLQILDAYSTGLGLRLGAQEGNPAMAAVMDGAGFSAFLLLKLAVVLGLSLLAARIAGSPQVPAWLHRSLVALALVTLSVVVANTWAIASIVW